MKSPIHRRPEAKLDLLQHYVYLARQNVEVAKRFLTSAQDAAKTLARFPGMGAARPVKNPALAGLRMWPIKRFENYLILYLPTSIGIDIVRVLHGARDIDTIFDSDN
jgi:toxin ParE1/3/4